MFFIKLTLIADKSIATFAANFSQLNFSFIRLANNVIKTL